MTTAVGPVRVTRGTKAQVDALTKNKPGRLLASILDAVTANQRMYVEMPDKTLRGLAWEGEGSSGSADGVYLVTKPKITGSNAGAIGGAVTLTASGSASAFNNDTDTPTTVLFNWTLPDGSKVNGQHGVDVPVAGTEGDVLTVRCQAEDSLGNKSQVVEHQITISANQPPSAALVVHDLPDTVVKGETYTVNLSGGTDADGDAITYELSSLIGCSASSDSGITSSVSITVDNNSTTLSFDVSVRDAAGLLSLDSVSVSRSSEEISNPSGSTGLLSEGTHTVSIPAGVDAITITGNGGAGTAAQYDCPSGYQLWGSRIKCSDNRWGTQGPSPKVISNRHHHVVCVKCNSITGTLRNSNGQFHHYLLDKPPIVSDPGTTGADTTISGTTSATFTGASAGDTTTPSASTKIRELDPSTVSVLTVVVAGRGGSVQIDW